MSELPTDMLDDVCDLIVDCPHSTPKWTDSGYLVLRNQNIRNGCLNLSNRSYTDKKNYLHRIKRAKPKKHDIIFTREAPMGEVCLVPDGLECCVGQRQVLLRANEGIDPVYLFYALQSPYVRHQILWNEGTGSTVSNVRIPILKKLKIPRHPNNENNIADILKAIEDKTDLNQRMNETLEAMARALFKSWFVDFDPVCAKAEGREPEGMDTATAALFPAAFNDDGLPEGWDKISVSDIGEVVTGKTPSTKDAGNYGHDIPFVTIPDMHNRIFVTECGKYLSKKGADSQKNKYLPAGSICISCIATPGLTILTHKFCQTNQQINAVIPSNTELSSFRYWQLKGMSEEVISKGSGGSVFHNLNKSQFSALKIIEPNIEAATFYAKAITPMMDRILFNQRQSITLSQLRDILLPNRISGELRIDDVAPVRKEAVG